MGFKKKKKKECSLHSWKFAIKLFNKTKILVLQSLQLYVMKPFENLFGKKNFQTSLKN